MTVNQALACVVAACFLACGAANTSNGDGGTGGTGGSSGATENCQNGVDDNGDGLVDCQDGTCVGNSACYLTCLDLCFSGDRICDTGGVKTCAKASTGCFTYGPAVACSGAPLCSAGQCVTTCSDVCTEGAKQCSASGGVVNCQRVGTGCTDWVGPTACATDKVCSGGACVDKSACSNQCTQGESRCLGSGQKQTCVKLSTGCTDWTFPTSCAAGHTCPLGKNTCETAPTTCTQGDKRCAAGGTGVEQCDAMGGWASVQMCGQGCAAGQCTASTSCSPGAVRCTGKDVQTCNTSGSAWLHIKSCVTGCNGGLCADACTAGQKRCNGAVPETCSAASVWSAGVTCTSGCWLGECVQPDLVIEGRTVTLSGDIRVGNAIVIRDGGILKVAASKDGGVEGLTLRAKSISIDSSSRIDANGAGPLPPIADCQYVSDDTSCKPGCNYVSYYAGGAAVRLMADTVTLNGTVTSYGGSSGSTHYRGDFLVAANALSGSGTLFVRAAKMLGGQSNTFAASPSSDVASTTSSLIPPLDVSSTTHSNPKWAYNDGAPSVSLSWSKPFPQANGYYYCATTDDSLLPGPGKPGCSYTQDESTDIPAAKFTAGQNYVHVLSVGPSSALGKVKNTFPVLVNDKAPTVTAPSHAQRTWTADPAVFMQWTNAQVDESFSGYAYVMDRFAETIPGPSATFVTSKQVLLANTQPGIWVFHLLSRDTRGYPTKKAAHYVVYVGAEPQKEALAGSITDAAVGAPLDSVTLKTNGGLFSVVTGPSGVYTFTGGHYVGSWTISPEKTGYVTQSKTVTLKKGTPVAVEFALVKAP